MALIKGKKDRLLSLLISLVMLLGFVARAESEDLDGDGLSNEVEAELGTNPNDADTDDDGLQDGLEYYFSQAYSGRVVFYKNIQMISADLFTLDPLDPSDGNADTDGDGLNNAFELLNGLDLLNAEDALYDADGDGLSNIAEFQLGTAVNNVDSDGDGLEDGSEVGLGTDPNNADSDNDGLQDGFEYYYRQAYNVRTVYYKKIQAIKADYFTLNPLDATDGTADFDGDGISNSVEISFGLNPIDPKDVFLDMDGDGIPNGWEIENGLDPTRSDLELDYDGDGLSNALEYQLGTSLLDADSDNDGLQDGIEYYYRQAYNVRTVYYKKIQAIKADYFTLNPLDATDAVADFDGDGISNSVEISFGLNPIDPKDVFLDMDGDGVPNGWEIENGLDPSQSDFYSDSDEDGLSNALEYQLGTSLFDADTDNDGLQDGLEYNFDLAFNAKVVFYKSYQMVTADHFTLDPLDASDGFADQDGDGISNSLEILNGLDLLDPADAILDTDGDGLSNIFEILNGFDWLDPSDAAMDSDGDGLTNIEEIQYGTSVDNADTDGDGMSDSYEILHGFDPLVATNEEDYSTVSIMKGQFNVGPSGAASYSVPIEVPPGINGMQPGLAFAYNSQAGNGDMGIGWTLAGKSAIVRCGTNTVADGYIDGVDYDDNDKFCMDGQKLILISGGSYGSDGSEYKVEIGGVDKIFARGTQGVGPRYFEIFHGNGRTSYYGNENIASDSMHWTTTGTSSTANVYAWHLNSQKDSFGNEVIYSYSNSTSPEPALKTWNSGAYTEGALLLTSISYSDYTIDFDWSMGKADASFGYLAPNTVGVNDYLLNKVSWQVGGNEIGSYNVSYQYSAAEKSYVASITQCSDGKCLRPTAFHIEGGTEDFYHSDSFSNSMSDTYFTDGTNDMGTQVVDINGDGLNDLVQLFIPANTLYYGGEPQHRVFLNDGEGFSSAPDAGYSDSLPNAYFTDGPLDMGTRFADLNGDGLLDLIQLYYSSTPNHYNGNPQRRVFLNNGSGFSALDTAFSNSLPDTYFTDGSKDMGSRLVDVDGDGLVDLIQLYNSQDTNHYNASPQRRVYLNNGSMFESGPNPAYSVNLPDAYFTDGTKDMGTRLADFNGDGLVDIIQLYKSTNNYYGGAERRRVHLNNGSRFLDSDTDYSNSLPDAFFTDGELDMGTRLTDLNGDGLVDLLQLYYSSTNNHYNGNAQHRAYLNNGRSFNTLDAGFSNTLPDTYFTAGSVDMGSRLADLNGDGLVDLVQLYHPTTANHYNNTPQRRVFLNTGRSFNSLSTFYSNKLPDAYFTDGSSDMGTRLSDVNGDGVFDIVQAYHASNYYSGNPQLRVFLTNVISHKVDSISKGDLIDGDIDINYESISVSDHYDRNVFGSYPEIVYQGPMQVVTSFQVDDGIGGKNTTTYDYEDLRMHVGGFGSLGFHKIISTDALNFTTMTNYSQDWQNRTSGMIEREWKIAPNGNVIATTVNSFDTYTLSHAGGNTYASLITRSTSLQRDLGGAFISASSKYNVLFSSDMQIMNAYDCVHDTDPTGGVPTSILSDVLSCSLGSEGLKKSTYFEYWDQSYFPNLPRQVKTKNTTFFGGTGSKYNTVAYDYDWTQGAVLKSQTMDPDGANFQLKTEYTYRSSGLQDTVTISGDDLLSDVTRYYYNDNGTLSLKVVGYGNQHLENEYFYGDSRFPWLVTATRDANTDSGYTTQKEYDQFGKAYLSVDRLGVARTKTQVWCADTWLCNANEGASYIEITTSPGSTDSHVIYDRLGRELFTTRLGLNDGMPETVVQTTRYNARGQTEFSSIPFYLSDAALYEDSGVTREYDDFGRVIRTVDQDNRESLVDYNGRATTYTNAKGQIKADIKNGQGQLVLTIDEYDKVMSYQYDAMGNLTETNDSEGNQWLIDYDNRGFKTSMSDPDKGNFSYTYDGAGRVRTQTNNKGQVTAITYDNLGRRLSRTEDRDGSNPVISTWSYETAGQDIGKLKSVAGNGFTENYFYDSYSRPYQTTTSIEGDSYTSTRTYDIYGRPATLNYPGSALALNYEYDSTTGVLNKILNAANDAVYWEANYQSASGKISAYSLGGQIDVSVNHNPNSGLIDSIYAIKGSTNLVSQNYAYDGLGNLTDRFDTVNDVHDQYYYDSLNRLATNNAFRNSSGALIAEQSMTYDAVGNILTKSDVEGGASYVYDGSGCGNANQTCAHAVSKIGNQNFVYDANGNMTSGYGRTLQYNAFDKPTYIEKDGKTTSFTYGPTRSRYKRVDNVSGATTTTYYVQGLMEVVVGSGTQTKLYLGDYAVVTQQDGQSDQTRYLLKDQLGSLIAIADEAGISQEKLNYDAWGKRRHLDGDWMNEVEFFSFASSMVTNRGYTGHEHLNEVGLIHMNGRVFDPLIARFISADPIIQAPHDMQSYNRYAYVRNNPLKYTDPSGFSWWSENVTDKFRSFRKNVSKAWRENWKTIVAVGLAAWGGWAVYGAIMNSALAAGPITAAAQASATIAASTAAGAASGAIMGASATALNGGNLRDVISAGLTGGVQGAVSGAMFGGISAYYGNTWSVGRAAASGVAGGISSEVSGGEFKDGAKFSFGMAFLRALHYKRNVFNTKAIGNLDAARADDSPMRQVGDKEALAHMVDIDKAAALDYASKTGTSFVSKFVGKGVFFVSESVFHGSKYITDAINGGTWNVISFSGWGSITKNPWTWGVAAFTGAGHIAFDVAPYGLWGNHGTSAHVWSDSFNYDPRVKI